jgi:PAS domain S-box-containing protein
MNVGSVVMIYAAFAAAWILLSDKVVEWFFNDPAELTTASIIKGWLFVAVTSLLLYRLLRPRPGAGASSERAISIRSRWGLPFALLALIVIAIAVASTVQTAAHYQEKEAARLDAIVEFKSRQFTDWLVERQADADFVRSSVHYADQYRQWRQGGDTAAGQRLQARLESFRGNRRFSGVTIVDPEGKTLWSSFGADPQMAPILRAAVEVAVRERKVERAGPYLDPAGRPQLDYVAPLGIGDRPAPVVVLHTDPANWLYPTLQSWPVPSKTGESYLFRRDGDQVLYLSELRHRADAALKLRLPVATPELLVAQVLRGEHREVEMGNARDYRDAPVLGMVHAIPGTDWYLAAEVDRTEVLGAVLREATWIGITSLLALFMAAAGFYLLRQRTQLAYAESIQTSQAERLRAQQLLAAIADGTDDPIFALDREGRFLLFNRAAERMTGKTVHEVMGRDETALFPAETARRQIADNRRIIERGKGMVCEETLPTAAGRRTYLVAKNALRDEHGVIVGLFSISRDITERKLAEQALRASEELLRGFFENAESIVWVKDLDGRFLKVNRYTENLLGRPREDILGRSVGEIFPQAEADAYADNDRQVLAAGSALVFEESAVLADGLHTFVSTKFPLRDAEGKIQSLGAICTDISGRKQAADLELRALHRQSEQWRALVAISASQALLDGDVEQLAREITEEVCRVTGVERANTWLFDEAETELRCIDLYEATTARHSAGAILKQEQFENEFRALKTAPYVNADDPLTDPRTAGYVESYLKPLGITSMLDAVIEYSGRHLGLLCFEHVGKAHRWEPDEISFACRLADKIALAITNRERRLAQERLSESEARFRALYENAAISIIVHDRDTGAIVQANRKAIESYGLSSLQELQRGDFWIEPPYSEEDALRLIRRAAAEGPQRFEWQNRDRHGQVFFEDVMLSNVILDDVERVMAVSLDITARKRAEEALQRQAEELRNRNAELERFNRAMVGRELEMVRLKREVNALAAALGGPARYDLAAVDGAPAAPPPGAPK